MNQTEPFNQCNDSSSLFDKEYFEEASFERIDNPGINLEGIEFYNCIFSNNILFKGIFKRCRFEKCTFKKSDLSLAKFTDSIFIDSVFDECKLIGIDWTLVSKPLRAVFDSCIISDSSFFSLDLIGTNLVNCIAHNVDFEKTNLSKSNCSSTDFLLSKFSGTNLSGADLRDARNYFINPAVNKIKKAKFSYPEVLTLLNVHEIIIE